MHATTNLEWLAARPAAVEVLAVGQLAGVVGGHLQQSINRVPISAVRSGAGANCMFGTNRSSDARPQPLDPMHKLMGEPNTARIKSRRANMHWRCCNVRSAA